MKTVEELLRPRYKVIADYPKSVYEVGTIINAGTTSEDCIYCDREGPRMRHYPHLFKKLEWWEERNPEEMPEYVKWESGKVTKVIRWKEGCDFCKVMDHTYFVSSAFFTPATLADYEQYLQQKR